MSPVKKTLLVVLGLLAAVFILGQIVMGQLILSGRADLIKAHQHSGYTAVVISIVYIVASLMVIAKTPTTTK